MGQAIAVRRVCFVSLHLPALSHLLFLHKVHIGGALDLYRLSLPVVQRQHKVEEVGLPQVGRRLLLKVSASQTHPAGRWTGDRHKDHLNGVESNSVVTDKLIVSLICSLVIELNPFI